MLICPRLYFIKSIMKKEVCTVKSPFICAPDRTLLRVVSVVHRRLAMPSVDGKRLAYMPLKKNFQKSFYRYIHKYNEPLINSYLIT